MHRTQIYLEPELSEGLDRLAREWRTSRADVLRTAARRLLQNEGVWEEDAIVGIIGLGSSELGDVSTQHDRYLAEHALRTMHP